MNLLKEVHKFNKGVCQYCLDKVALKDADLCDGVGGAYILVHKACNKPALEELHIRGYKNPKKTWTMLEKAGLKERKNESFLIQFTYDYYCQGYESTRGIVLVKNVPGFEAACNRIKMTKQYSDARDFENLTIDI